MSRRRRRSGSRRPEVAWALRYLSYAVAAVVVGASVAIYVRDSTTGLFNVLLLAGLATALLLRWLARKGM